MENWKIAFLLVSAGLIGASLLTVASVEHFRPDWDAPRRWIASRWRRRWLVAAFTLDRLSHCARWLTEHAAIWEAQASTMAFRFRCIYRATYRPKRLDEIGAPI